MPGRFFLIEDIGGMGDPPRHNVAPGQEVITMTAEGTRHMRWGLIPSGRVNARGRPVLETLINARSETVFDKSAFAGVGRAVVPASGWYEWTGEARRKQPWRIRRKDGGLIYFAAVYDVWTAPGGVDVAQVATITCPPSADVREVHHRMGVILEESQIAQWFSADDTEARALLRPYPDGRLAVENAEGIDWDAS